MISKILKIYNGIVFDLTKLLFSIIPVFLMIFGSFIPLFVLFSWIANWISNESINLGYIWYVILGLIITTMGFQWNDAIIDSYGDSIATKRNSEKWELERKKNSR